MESSRYVNRSGEAHVGDGKPTTKAGPSEERWKVYNGPQGLREYIEMYWKRKSSLSHSTSN